MTLTLPYNEIQFVSDGVIDTYSFSTFAIQNLTQLVVDIYNAAGVLVNPALYPYDANITDPTSDLPRNSIVFSDDVPPENYIIVISRLTEQTQEVSFSTLGGYNSKNLENILSKIVQMIQEEGYKLDHNVPALDPLQTDWLFDRLLTNNALLYIDTINKTIKQTSFPKENVVQATGGMYLRQVLQNGYYIVEYSMDNVNWTPILNGGAGNYHNNLLGRDVADAHPASAITGVAEHIADIDNPHSVTKAQVGLGNCDNTSDADKPVSDATQDALDLKADLSGATFTGDISANNLSGTNTGDQDLSGYADLSGATFTGDISATNLSGTNTGDQDLSGYALLSGATFSGQISAPNIIAGNTIYGGTISANLDTITKSGLYTCYGTATGVPSADYSWFVLHQNSNVGTTSATQRAVAYDNTTLQVYERVKMTTWGTWVLQGSGGGGSSILPTGTCSTAGSTAAKEVTVAGYTETAGACALITFENKNTALGPALYIPFTGGTAADPMGVYTLTTIGSPTYTGDKFNSNGLTGLSYNITSLGSGAWCIQGLFKSTNITAVQDLMWGNADFTLLLRKTNGNKLILFISANGSTWGVVNGVSGSKSDWGTGTEYYIRVRFTGTQYLVDWSTDGINWTNDITSTSSTTIVNVGRLTFGVSHEFSTNPLIGTMDDLYVTIGSATTITDYPTLNINSGGAKYMCHEDGTRITPANPAYFIANCPIQFCYDGTGYRFKQEVVKNYVVGTTWYNLSNTGWVEQGFIATGGAGGFNVLLPLPMANTSYSLIATVNQGNSAYPQIPLINKVDATQIWLRTVQARDSGAGANMPCSVMVSGYAA